MRENSKEDNFKKSKLEQESFDSQKYLKILDGIQDHLGFIEEDLNLIQRQIASGLADNLKVSHPENGLVVLKHVKEISNGPFIRNFRDDLTAILDDKKYGNKMVRKVLDINMELKIAQGIVWDTSENKELLRIMNNMSSREAGLYENSEIFEVFSFYNSMLVLKETTKKISEIIRQNFNK